MFGNSKRSVKTCQDLAGELTVEHARQLQKRTQVWYFFLFMNRMAMIGWHNEYVNTNWLIKFAKILQLVFDSKFCSRCCWCCDCVLLCALWIQWPPLKMILPITSNDVIRNHVKRWDAPTPWPSWPIDPSPALWHPGVALWPLAARIAPVNPPMFNPPIQRWKIHRRSSFSWPPTSVVVATLQRSILKRSFWGKQKKS